MSDEAQAAVDAGDRDGDDHSTDRTVADPVTPTTDAADDPSASDLQANPEAGHAQPDASAPAPETTPETIPKTIPELIAKVGNDNPVSVPTLPRRKWFKHRVVPREQVEQVAHRYGVAVEDLREWNGLSEDTHRMRLGARLRVLTARVPPHREKVRYTVVEGDTWWSVGLRHGVDARDIRAYNYPSRGKMSPGSSLQIWIDPIVHDWIVDGGDPMPDDDAFALRRGGIGVGSPDAGWLVNGVRIPKGDGYHLRLPKSAYGTSHAVAQILIGLAWFRQRSTYGRELELGAMSRPRGGELKGHRSHQTGRDLDIRLPRREGIASWTELTRRRIDWPTTWLLVDAMLRADVRVIFLDYGAQKQVYRAAKAAGVDPARLAEVLQYPDGRSAIGLVRHSPGHEKHLHVRVGCGPFELECVD